MKTYKRKNTIPRPLAAVIILARNAHAGALGFGATTGLAHNTAEKIGAERHDLLGNPATPLVPGKQAQYAAQLVAVKAAYAEKNVAIRDGREFCRLAISLLRPVLGNEWNTAWQAAGFHQPSLALPAQPVAMLTALRAHFATNPAHENGQANVTAVEAEFAAAAIDAALLAVGSAKRELIILKKERDRALKTLRKRLSGLRAELEQLLEDDSGTWYEFGFKRPADGRMPEPLDEVTATEVASGTVQVTWSPTIRAEGYRLTVRLAESDAPPIEDVIVADHSRVIPGLPNGAPLIIAVSARNRSGETRATQVELQTAASSAIPGSAAG